MLSKQEAIEIIERKLKSMESENSGNIIIVDEYTIEAERYFIFYYDSKKYIETDDSSFALLGNVPILIDRVTFKMYYTGATEDITYYERLFERGELRPIGDDV